MNFNIIENINLEKKINKKLTDKLWAARKNHHPPYCYLCLRYC